MKPSDSAPKASASVIEAEYVEPPFRGCLGPGAPVLYLIRGQRTLLDGHPSEDDAALGEVLAAKRRLHVEVLGGTLPLDIVIQYDRDLEPGRLERSKKLVAEHGFIITAMFESKREEVRTGAKSPRRRAAP